MATDNLAALNERIENLEMKYAYQERLVEELSKIVREHSDKLGGVLSKVKDIVAEMKSAGNVEGKDQKPPHY
jgi:uncharacterized coiled-coil protein SlyX